MEHNVITILNTCLLCVTFDELGDVPVDGLGELLVGGVARPWHYLQSKPGQQHTIQ